MTTVDFTISQEEKDELIGKYSNLGKNSDVGKLAVEIAKKYFSKIMPGVKFIENRNGVDIMVDYNGKMTGYEIKGTVDSGLAWPKLKVSSQRCYENIKNGMEIMRIVSIGQLQMKIYFLKNGEDFELQPEPRWCVKPICKKNANS
ncbi:MAG: hypothetical protein U0T75_09785 [Chitinophagales bacterium]